MSIDGTLQTKFGPIKYAWTQRDHVYLSTDGPEGNSILVNRVAIHVGLHLHATGTHGWSLKTPIEFHTYRAGTFAGASVSAPARKAILAELLKVWSEFALGSPEIADQAEIDQLEKQITKLTEKVSDLEKELRITNTSLAERRQRLESLAAHSS